MSEFQIGISVVVLFIILIILIRSPFKIINVLSSMFIKLIIGGFFIFIANIIGSTFDFHIPLNIVTAAISGLLGIPGVIALGVVQYFII